MFLWICYSFIFYGCLFLNLWWSCVYALYSFVIFIFKNTENIFKCVMKICSPFFFISTPRS